MPIDFREQPAREELGRMLTFLSTLKAYGRPNRSVRVLSFLLCFSCIISFTIGCTPQTEGASQTTTITWMQWYVPGWGEHFVRDELLADFSRQNPDVKVELKSVQFSAVSPTYRTWWKSESDIPDVLSIIPEWCVGMAHQGKIEPLDAYLAAEPLEFSQGFVESVVPRWKEQVWGLPVMAGCTAMFYNKRIFSEANAEPPKTWDEFLAISQQVAAPDKGVYAIEAGGFGGIVDEPDRDVYYLFFPWFYAAGGNAIQGGKPAIDSDAGVRTMSLWYKLIHQYQVSGANYDRAAIGDMRKDFASGHVAMHVDGNWFIPILEEMGSTVDFGVRPLPSLVHDGASSNAQLLAISAASKNKEAAWRLVKYLTGDTVSARMARKSNSLPARKALLRLPEIANDPHLSVFAEIVQSPNTRLTGLLPEYDLLVRNALRQAVIKCLIGIQAQGERGFWGPTRDEKVQKTQEFLAKGKEVEASSEAGDEMIRQELSKASLTWNKTLEKYLGSGVGDGGPESKKGPQANTG